MGPSMEGADVDGGSAAVGGCLSSAKEQAQPENGSSTGHEDEEPRVASKGKRQPLEKPGQADCPRCGSSDTKFCYYNNYNVKQPRYFCKVGANGLAPAGSGLLSARCPDRVAFGACSAHMASQVQLGGARPKGFEKGTGCLASMEGWLDTLPAALSALCKAKRHAHAMHALELTPACCPAQHTCATELSALPLCVVRCRRANGTGPRGARCATYPRVQGGARARAQPPKRQRSSRSWPAS